MEEVIFGNPILSMSEAGWATKDKVQTPEVFTAKNKKNDNLNILSIVLHLQNNAIV